MCPSVEIPRLFPQKSDQIFNSVYQNSQFGSRVLNPITGLLRGCCLWKQDLRAETLSPSLLPAPFPSPAQKTGDKIWSRSILSTALLTGISGFSASFLVLISSIYQSQLDIHLWLQCWVCCSLILTWTWSTLTYCNSIHINLAKHTSWGLKLFLQKSSFYSNEIPENTGFTFHIN